MSATSFNIQIEEARLEQGRARVSIFGPSGCGKTLTGLIFADAWADLLESEKPIVIDTEHRTSSKYAGLEIPGTKGERKFKFDTIPLSAPFSPDHYIAAIKTAEAKGYKVCLIDSISHEWMGEGGAQQMADEAGARMGGNRWAGWSVATPAHNRFLETILGSDMHIIVTMRAKTEWIQEGGKPKKVGLGPVQRENVEYEFDIVLQQDMDHSVEVLKSRSMDVPVGIVIEKPDRSMAEGILNWLQKGVERKTELEPEEAKSTNGTASAKEKDESAAEKIKAPTKTKITKLMKELGEKHADYDGLVVKDKEGNPVEEDGEPKRQTWDERMADRMAQWYKTSDVAELSEEQGKDLVGKLQDTIVQLDRKKAEAEAEGGSLA